MLTVDRYIDELVERYSIRRDFAELLRDLEDYEIVILCDDSGSMKMQNKDIGKSRWEELKDIVKIVLHIGTVFDSNGVDVYFLNRPEILNVTDPRNIDEAFKRPPRGFSRLAKALQYIFGLDAAKPGGDKKLLVFVATDAEPTNNDDKRDLSQLESVMRHERQADTTYVTFLLCNDKPECFEYMSQWDEDMKNVDVVVDYRRQKELVHKYQGEDYSFSFGDYVVKALLGAINEEMDALGEAPPA